DSETRPKRQPNTHSSPEAGETASPDSWVTGLTPSRPPLSPRSLPDQRLAPPAPVIHPGQLLEDNPVRRILTSIRAGHRTRTGIGRSHTQRPHRSVAKTKLHHAGVVAAESTDLGVPAEAGCISHVNAGQAPHRR